MKKINMNRKINIFKIRNNFLFFSLVYIVFTYFEN